MKYQIIIRTEATSEQRLTVAAPNYLEALKQVGYYASSPDVRQILITRDTEPAKVLHLVGDGDTISEKE